MIKKFTSLLVFLFLFQLGMAQSTYDKIRIWSDNTNEIISELQVLGIDPEGFDVRPGV
jgi:hypothetical protein